MVDKEDRWRSFKDSMWDFLETNYDVAVNECCGTHVHVSTVGGWTLDTLKNMCHSIIHFEPAIEAILPSDRRGNEYAKSNWVDNPHFARKNLGRKGSMALIQRCTNIRDLVALMHPGEGGFDKMYGWNITYINKSAREGTAEFRRGSASTNFSDALMWMEFAMAFVVSAINKGTIENLQKVPATLGGLKWFVEDAARSSGPAAAFTASSHMQRLFNGKREDLALQPKLVGRLSPDKVNKLKRKEMEDKKRSIALAKMTKRPYW